MKRCAKCKAEKPPERFGRSAQTPDGLRAQCRDCRKAEGAARADAKREYDRDRYLQVRPEALERAAQYRQTLDPAKQRAYMSTYYRANPEPFMARAVIQRTGDSRAVPEWRNKFFIAEIYDLAAMRTKATGIEWHVDHVVPLRSSLVCGLHVETNLQVVPAALNWSKGNRAWPDMP